MGLRVHSHPFFCPLFCIFAFDMSQLGYYLIIKPLSFLPLRLLHFFSTGLYYLFYFVVKYRRQVVARNLLHAFPQSTAAWREHISRQFYRHLCDLIMESIKWFSISEQQAVKRCRIRNPEILDQFFEQGKNVVIVGSHYGNWELTALIFPSQQKHQISSIFSNIKNKFIKEKITKSRGRYGSHLIPIPEVPAYFDLNHPRSVALAFIGDQVPAWDPKKNIYWTEFLNQETAVAMGAEKYARKYDLPVVYVQILKQRRGYYEIELELVTDQPLTLQPYELTDRHLRMLERLILGQPQFWLWSHRRWKYNKNGKPIH